MVFFLAAVPFFFLVLGSIAYTLCGLIPWFRRYALSSALWFAVWGPCIVAWFLLAGLAVIAKGFAVDSRHWSALHLPVPGTILSGLFALAVLCGIIGLASVAAWLHQRLIERLTLALFRIYAMVVSAGVGSVWGWCFLLWLGSETNVTHTVLIWLPGMAALIAAFGYFGYRFAKDLRGFAPERFTWVTKAEFEGS